MLLFYLQIYPSELQLNKALAFDTEISFLDVHLTISNGFELSKINVRCDHFDFAVIVNIPLLDGDVPLSTSNGAYISQLTRFDRVSSHVTDFYTCNKF